MKRLLLIVMCLVLLCGCQDDKPAKTTLETTPAVIQPQYLPQGSVKQDNGLRSYAISQPVEGLLPMGEDLIMVSTTPAGNLQLCVLRGGEPAAYVRRELEQGVSIADCIRTTESGMAYFCGADNSVVILDSYLQEATRIQLPQDNQGRPGISGDFSRIYYTSADQIRVLELKTGVSRLLKQHICQSQHVLGLADGDALLVCSVTVDDHSSTVFIDTGDGRTLGEYDEHVNFVDAAAHYYLQRWDGTVMEHVFGDYEGSAHNFVLEQQGKNFSYVSANHTMVVSEKAQEGVWLDAYDLATGKHTARVAVSGAKSAADFVANGQGIWFVAETEQGLSLCCWDPSATALTDTALYTTPHYTAQSPNREGLAALQARADALGGQYGVKIVVTPEDVSQPKDYALTTEHQIKALEAGMAVLEKTLPRFPEGFFAKIVEDTGNEVLTISLVRSISGDKMSLQYWMGSDAHIALAVGADMEQLFYHELSHVLDAFIFANSRDLDVWDKLNPEGFVYDYSYDVYKSHGTEYLEGKGQAFVDTFSRTYPKEDRARVFEYAMMPDKEASFDSEIMQKKLHLLSFSIRDAFDWKRDERAFPWEYYLEEPLAYTKKK